MIGLFGNERAARAHQQRDKLKMKSFLEIDSFFNFVYWNLIEE